MNKIIKKSENLFKWKHFLPEIILLCLRWYLKYKLSFRDLAEIMSGRGLSLVHTTIMRWIHEYSPIFNKKIKKYLKNSTNSYRLDETYVEINEKWYYLYRAIDSKGNTPRFILSAKRDKKAAKRFIKKVLSNSHVVNPRVAGTDKAPSYTAAINELKSDGQIDNDTKHRRYNIVGNIIEQAGCMASSGAVKNDQHHRFIKWRIKPMFGFFSFKTANRILQGTCAMHRVKKIQIKDFFKIYKNDKIFFDVLFGIAL